MSRKICVFTGTRADYGHLYWLLKEIQDAPELELELLVSGSHLAQEFGHTVDEIVDDGFRVNEQVDMLLADDSPVAVAKSMGLGLIGYAEALTRMTPDILVVLGDRYEALAAAEAAMMLRIPIAHIHGGETTEGAIDNRIRHAITQLADWHFPATPEYAERIVAMGIDPARVITAGAPGLDRIARAAPADRAAFEAETNIGLGQKNLMVTYHPATAVDENPGEVVAALADALTRMPDVHIIVTGANADSGGRAIDREWAIFAKDNPGRVFVVPSLGIRLYHAALHLVDAVVGNSSSGLIEAPAVGVPTVNIGARQDGRARAPSVIDCDVNRNAIAKALQRALGEEMKAVAARRISPYGTGGASALIKDALQRAAAGECRT